MRKIVVATNGSTGGSSIEAERIASNEDEGGGDENGLDEEEDKAAEEVEVGVNPPNLPPIIHGNLLHSFDSAGDNNNEGGINSSYPTNDDDDCQGSFNAATMPSSQARGGSEK